MGEDGRKEWEGMKGRKGKGERAEKGGGNGKESG